MIECIGQIFASHSKEKLTREIFTGPLFDQNGRDPDIDLWIPGNEIEGEWFQGTVWQVTDLTPMEIVREIFMNNSWRLSRLLVGEVKIHRASQVESAILLAEEGQNCALSVDGEKNYFLVRTTNPQNGGIALMIPYKLPSGKWKVDFSTCGLTSPKKLSGRFFIGLR